MTQKIPRWLCFAISILTILALRYLTGAIADRVTPEDFIGTWCTNPQAPGDGTYLVLEQEGTYLLYKQLQVLEQGRYFQEKELGKVTSIRCVSGTVEETVYLVGDNSSLCMADGLYRAEQASLVKFEKISDVPTYINLKNQ